MALCPSFDTFDSLQFHCIDAKRRERILQRLAYDEFKLDIILEAVVRWRKTDLHLLEASRIEALQKMFDELLQRKGMCKYFCTNPREHFEDRQCASIGVLREKLQTVDPTIDFMQGIYYAKEEILDELCRMYPDFNEAYSGLQKHPEDALSVYKFTNEQNSSWWKRQQNTSDIDVIILDTFYLEQDNHDVKKVALNLYENIHNNFNLFLVPKPRDNKSMEHLHNFVDLQLQNNADCIIIFLTSKYQEVLHDKVPGQNDNRFRLKYFKEKISRLDIPLFVCILPNQNLEDTAYSMSKLVFHVPDEIRELLVTIRRVVKVLLVKHKSVSDSTFNNTNSSDQQQPEIERGEVRSRSSSVPFQIINSFYSTGCSIVNTFASLPDYLRRSSPERIPLLGNENNAYSNNGYNMVESAEV